MKMNAGISLAIVLLVYGSFLVDCSERSVSTSIAGMEELLDIEKELFQSLSSYADELEKKLNIIHSIIRKKREELAKAAPNVENHLSNPLNAFSLIRRMHADWLNIMHYLQQPIGVEPLKNLESQRSNLPTTSDFSEAFNAIKRLQTTYDMKAADMAAGRLNGKQYEARFSSLDSYTIGFELLKVSQYFDACNWLYVALQTYDGEDIYVALDFQKQKILELYAETFVKLFRFKDALAVLDSALTKNPTDIKIRRRKTEIEVLEITNTQPPSKYLQPQPSKYQTGCRGNFPYRSSKLSCRYNTTTSAYVKIAPIKMEEVSVEPYMILFHDVLTDKEIAHLKEIGRPGLQRATVYSNTERKSIVVETRTSKFSWLNDNATEITKRINRRIADMTGFDLRGSEALQVMNYGLGGHYDLHYDFFNSSTDDRVISMHGNRISTVLFYMSDVEQGGATVFPHLKVAIKPQKGSAVMWYNLNSRGEGDIKTMHAACPVIVGSKWVCNKWIREGNQFRTRPCTKT